MSSGRQEEHDHYQDQSEFHTQTESTKTLRDKHNVYGDILESCGEGGSYSHPPPPPPPTPKNMAAAREKCRFRLELK